MYNLFKFLEKINIFINIKIKIIYWKLKYGKRIKIGKNISFRKKININIGKNGFLKIGNNNFFNNYCSINCHEKIIIGDNNLFGENVKLYDHNHVFNNKEIDIKTNFKTHPILIGNNNWFGSNVTLLSKSKIQDFNVISANTCINESIDNGNIIKNNCKIAKTKIRFK